MSWDNEEEGDQSSDTAGDRGDCDKPLIDNRLQLALVSFLICIAIFIAWSLFGICAGAFGQRIYFPLLNANGNIPIWIVPIVVGVTISALFFLPWDDD